MATAPDLRFPSIDGLRAFEAAARLGTFERAADELAVSASAVSKRVATLEELLATALLQRGAKALTLTAAGKEYLGQVSAALGLLAAMPLHQRAAQRVQRLRVTAPPTFARQILVPRLQSFTAAHPEIELELMLSIPYLAHSPHDSDIEVLSALDSDAEVLLDERVVAVASRALIARLPPLREPEDLEHAPLLRTPIEPWTPWLRAAGLPWPEPSSGPRLVDLGLTLEAAVSGQGVALARHSLARQWLASGVLQALFPHISAPAAHPYRLSACAPDGPAPLFAAWLKAQCAQVQAESHAWISGLA